MEKAIKNIEIELEEQVKYFKGEDKLLEAQRIAERTNFDIEMMRETGFFVLESRTTPDIWRGLRRGSRPIL